MGIIIDPELYKPLKCTECGGKEIAKMINQGTIRCLGCGKQKNDPDHFRNIMKREMETGNDSYTKFNNPKDYRDF